jgi:hypothetical protein
LAEALTTSERRVEELRGELTHIRRCREAVFKAPPRVWIEERISTLQKVLEKRTQKSALLLRRLLGKIQLKPTKGDIGRPYYVAKSNMQDVPLVEVPVCEGLTRA